MKLMLTSAGITNKSLAKALKKLVGKRIKIAFIPTAANGSNSKEKGWLIKNYNECERLGSVDIVDISAIDKKMWLPRLKAANVIVMGGGTTPYLMRWVIKSGLKKELPELLATRVYVGISAGSIITGKRISGASEFLFSKNVNEAPLGLGYVDFNFRSHFNSPESKFSKLRNRYLKRVAKRLNGDLYALDDNSALIYSDGKIKVVSEGKWMKY